VTGPKLLVTRADGVIELADDLDAAVAELVGELVGASWATQRATKRQLGTRALEQEAAPDFDEDLLREVYAGEDFAEGVRAFLAKERPAWATVLPNGPQVQDG
jgi:enoyl-CoA hydratase/carnithine racemase